MVVLEKSPSVFLIALFVRGFWLEVRIEDQSTSARYLYAEKVIGQLRVGQA